jgi:probable F420-dependent oxidoreductase
MTSSKRIRFGTGIPHINNASLPELITAARRAEDLGFSTFAIPDHFFTPYAPLVALQAIADATTTIRVSNMMLAQDFRHPAMLAKELATLDILSGGRVEVGIGAGWVAAEYEQAGIPFDKASVRIERLEEVVAIIRGLFGNEPLDFRGNYFTITGLDGTPKPIQKPRPPIMIGAGGPKILGVAARQADIIQMMPGPNHTNRPSSDPTRLTARAYWEKIHLIQDAAGGRFPDIELGTLLRTVTITDDRERASDDFLARVAAPGGPVDGSHSPSREELLASPVVAIGTLEEVCDKLLAVRDEFGLTYFAGPVEGAFESLGPVIERLANIQ